MSYRIIAALAVVGLVGSCETACGCSPIPPASANIVGTVSETDGSPVADAIVGLIVDVPCGVPATVHGVAPTSASGEYAIAISAGDGGPRVVCFDIFAARSNSSPDTVWSRDHSVTADVSYPTTRIDLSFAP